MNKRESISTYMNSINKNTWLIYYALVGLGAILLLVNINNKYDELLAEKKHEQLYITKIVASDIDAMLLKYETMIDLVSEDFSEDHDLNQDILRSILQKSELLIGFSLYNTDGTLHTKSNNMPDSKHYDLSPEQHFYSWFKSGLEAERMMVNKPTYSRILRKWIIPIQKRLLDKEGNVIGIMTSAIDLKKLEQKWPRSKAFGNSIELTLDQQFYQLLHTGTDLQEYQKIHNNPLAFRQSDKTRIQLEKQNLTIDQLRHNDTVAQIIVTIGKERILHSIAYSKNYEFWAHSSRPLSTLIRPLLNAISLLHNPLYFSYHDCFLSFQMDSQH